MEKHQHKMYVQLVFWISIRLRALLILARTADLFLKKPTDAYASGFIPNAYVR
jgi:hypothetical protein